MEDIVDKLFWNATDYATRNVIENALNKELEDV